MYLTGKPFEASHRKPKKKQKKDSRPCKKNNWTQGFWKQQNYIYPANSTV